MAIDWEELKKQAKINDIKDRIQTTSANTSISAIRQIDDLAAAKSRYEEEQAELNRLLRIAARGRNPTLRGDSFQRELSEAREKAAAAEAEYEALRQKTDVPTDMLKAVAEAKSRNQQAQNDSSGLTRKAIRGRNPSLRQDTYQQELSGAREKAAAAEAEYEALRKEAGIPTALERVGLVSSGAGQDYAGSALNAFSTLADYVATSNVWTEEQGLIDTAAQIQASQINKLLEDPDLTDDSRQRLEYALTATTTKPTAEEILNVYDPIEEAGNNLIAKGQANTEAAKRGLGKFGRFVVDTSTGGLQLLGDIAIGALTGGSSLIPMGVRAFGSAAQEAENAGASINQQIGYGLLSAGTAVLTEKLSNVGSTLTKAFGKGALDDVLQNATAKAINRFISGKTGQTLASRLASGMLSGAGEGLEEMIEAVLTPLYQKITYDPDAQWNAEEILYNGLVGAALGVVTGSGGGNAEIDRQLTAQRTTTNASAAQASPGVPQTSLSDFNAVGDTAAQQELYKTGETPNKTDGAPLQPRVDKSRLLGVVENAPSAENTIPQNRSNIKSDNMQTGSENPIVRAIQERQRQIQQARENWRSALFSRNNAAQQGTGISENTAEGNGLSFGNLQAAQENALLKAIRAHGAKAQQNTATPDSTLSGLVQDSTPLSVDGVSTTGYTGSTTEGTGDLGKIITEIKYKPSFGAILKANPNKTTTVLGSFDRDMKNIVNEMGNVKSTYFGAKQGGFNVLNVPDNMYKDADQFWNEINKPWLDEVIKRGDDIVLATKPQGKVMQSYNKITGEWGPSGFAREYQYLCDKGYHYDSTINMMVK